MTPGDCFENYVLFKNFKFNTVFSFKKDENTQKLACEVDKSNVDYEFKYATKNAGILDLVSYHAQGYIGDVLKYSFEDKTELSTYLSGYLEEMNPYTDELISDLKVDYSLLEEPKIEEDKIHFYITGLLFQKDERSKIEEVLKNYKEGKCNKFKQIELGRKEIGIKISQDTFNNNLNLLVKSKQIVKEYDDNENAEEWKKIFTSEYHYRIEMNHFQNLNFGKEGFSLSNVELKSDVRVRLPLNKKFEFEFTQKVNFNNLKISADNSIMTADIEEGNLDVQITRKTINDNDILEKIKNKTLNPIFEIISKKATKIIQQKFGEQTRLMLDPIKGFKFRSIDLEIGEGFIYLGSKFRFLNVEPVPEYKSEQKTQKLKRRLKRRRLRKYRK